MKKELDFVKSFWAKVTKTGPDDCWFWTGAINAKGTIDLIATGKTWIGVGVGGIPRSD